MGDAARKLPTYQDVLDAPPNMVAELVHGSLELHPRPRSVHALAAGGVFGDLFQPYSRGAGGPGGWILLIEPEVHLGGNVLVPDLAGWRRERMPTLPDVAYFELAPDWVCEVLSPSTTRLDRTRKVPLYAQHGVGHVWLIDPASQLLEVLKLDGPGYRVHQVFAGDDVARADPFGAVELKLASLWAT